MLIRIQNEMGVACEDDGRGDITQTRNDIPVMYTRERKPKKKKVQSSCLKQFFDNPVIRNLPYICAAIIHPPQDVNLHRARLVSRVTTN